MPEPEHTFEPTDGTCCSCEYEAIDGMRHRTYKCPWCQRDDEREIMSVDGNELRRVAWGVAARAIDEPVVTMSYGDNRFVQALALCAGEDWHAIHPSIALEAGIA